jgi:uncharacterized protein
MDVDQLRVEHFPERNVFEIHTQGYTAVLNYTLNDSIITFTHTDVPPALEGQGVGSKLVKAGFEYARANGLKIRSLCSFVDGYLKRHPEYHT